MGKPGRRDPVTASNDAGRTRGTETSQYPQEEKITMIPPVVASERGIAQTLVVAATQGVVGPSPVHEDMDSGTRWKARPQRVTAPYTKSVSIRPDGT